MPKRSLARHDTVFGLSVCSGEHGGWLVAQPRSPGLPLPADR